eukprot:353465-Chlamydomonas_euryale.AAC.7
MLPCACCGVRGDAPSQSPTQCAAGSLEVRMAVRKPSASRLSPARGGGCRPVFRLCFCTHAPVPPSQSHASTATMHASQMTPAHRRRPRSRRRCFMRAAAGQTSSWQRALH